MIQRELKDLDFSKNTIVVSSEFEAAIVKMICGPRLAWLPPLVQRAFAKSFRVLTIKFLVFLHAMTVLSRAVAAQTIGSWRQW